MMIGFAILFVRLLQMVKQQCRTLLMIFNPFTRTDPTRKERWQQTHESCN
jgi:hypothetical protein